MRKLAEREKTAIALIILAVGALALLPWPARAADLGSPVMAAPGPKAAHPLQGCFGEFSASGQFLKADRVATAAVGFGCDIVKVNLLQFGGAVRYDIGESNDVRSGSFTLRAGLLLNPSTSIYGFGEWRVKDLKFKTNGSAYFGPGVEIQAFMDGFTIFTEASIALSEFGKAYERDDMQIRAGGRLRF